MDNKWLLNFKFDISKEFIKIGKFTFKTEVLYNVFFKCIKILLILIIMYLIIKISNSIINRFIEKQNKLKFSLDEKRSKTLGEILKSLVRYSVYFLGIFGIVEILFGRIGLTFAGIGGVAVGLGAQSLIKDIINGFFILLENQYSVGEYVDIEDKKGIIESIELRVTKIRDFNGDLHIIPNGIITKVTNHCRGDKRILLEIDIAYEEDIDNAISVISQVCEEFKNKNENIVSGPEVYGVSALKDSSVTITVLGMVKCMTQWKCEMELRKEIKNTLDKKNIEIPYPRLKIVKEE